MRELIIEKLLYGWENGYERGIKDILYTVGIRKGKDVKWVETKLILEPESRKEWLNSLDDTTLLEGFIAMCEELVF